MQAARLQSGNNHAYEYESVFALISFSLFALSRHTYRPMGAKGRGHVCAYVSEAAHGLQKLAQLALFAAGLLVYPEMQLSMLGRRPPRSDRQTRWEKGDSRGCGKTLGPSTGVPASRLETAPGTCPYGGHRWRHGRAGLAPVGRALAAAVVELVQLIESDAIRILICRSLPSLFLRGMYRRSINSYNMGNGTETHAPGLHQPPRLSAPRLHALTRQGNFASHDKAVLHDVRMLLCMARAAPPRPGLVCSHPGRWAVDVRMCVIFILAAMSPRLP